MLYLMVKICSLSSMLREKVNIPKKKATMHHA
jgi:hypothetical protein